MGWFLLDTLRNIGPRYPRAGEMLLTSATDSLTSTDTPGDQASPVVLPIAREHTSKISCKAIKSRRRYTIAHLALSTRPSSRDWRVESRILMNSALLCCLEYKHTSCYTSFNSAELHGVSVGSARKDRCLSLTTAPPSAQFVCDSNGNSSWRLSATSLARTGARKQKEL